MGINELMDKKPQELDSFKEQVVTLSKEWRSIKRVSSCLIRKSGIYFLIDLTIQVDPNLTVVDSHIIASKLEDSIYANVDNIQNVITHVEPYFTD